MADLAKYETLAQRLENKLLAPDTLGGPPKGVLLLDVSGSMFESTGDGSTKIESLRKVVRALNPERIFTFSDNCYEQKTKDIPNPWADTMYGRAFERMKAEGIKELVMVTDGIPTDPDAAREHIQGLKVEFLYVGPPPRPPILDELAKLCGGSVTSGSLSVKERLRLVQKIRGLLTAGEQ